MLLRLFFFALFLFEFFLLATFLLVFFFTLGYFRVLVSIEAPRQSWSFRVVRSKS